VIDPRKLGLRVAKRYRHHLPTPEKQKSKYGGGPKNRTPEQHIAVTCRMREGKAQKLSARLKTTVKDELKGAAAEFKTKMLRKGVRLAVHFWDMYSENR